MGLFILVALIGIIILLAALTEVVERMIYEEEEE
tara:strand:+ start:259 stop:360 length:102 start_codon:yes stop_codon:yes gene_type:complete